jgi:uncharacterized OsmC-like protein
MSSEPGRFSITLDSIKDYEFRVKFDKEQFEDILMDEPPPVGGDTGPNAPRLLAAAVGNCLSASLLFCARKSRVDVDGVHTEVSVQYTRNEKGRIRIGKIDVAIEPKISRREPDKARRCLELFQDYCVVTESVRTGIDVSVAVKA